MKNSDMVTFTPRARPGESPGGILLRFTGEHFDKPTFILSYYGFKVQDLRLLIKNLYRGDTDILGCIADLSNWHRNPLLKYLALKRTSLDWYHVSASKLCPLCAEEDFLPAVHDLLCVDTCTRHKLTLLTHCQTCSERITWSRPCLTHCKCFEKHTLQLPATPENITFCEAIEELVSENNDEGLSLLIRLNSIIFDRYEVENSKIIALALYERNTDPLILALARFQRQHSKLSQAAIVAPLAKILKELGYCIETIVSSISYISEFQEPKSLPSSFALTRNEILFALGCSSTNLNSLTRDYFSVINEKDIEGRYTLILLESFFYYFTKKTTTSIVRNVSPIYHLIQLTGRPLADWVLDIIAGKYRVIEGISLLDGLFHVQIDLLVSDNDLVPVGSMTHKQAAQYCGMYSEALSFARNSHLVTGFVQHRQLNRYLYTPHDLDVFLETYVTAGMLAKELSTPARVLKAKLKYLGINPVAGPQIDSSGVYFFAKNELVNVTTAQLHEIQENYSEAGRKPNSHKDTLSTFTLVASEVEKELGVSVQRLKYLTQVTPLLEIGANFGSYSTQRHFDKASVFATKEFISQLIPISTLEPETALTHDKLVRRINLFLQNAIIRINDCQYLEPYNAKVILRHCTNYWCASVASNFLNCSRYDIQNWIRLGHLHPLQNSHPDFIQNFHLFHSEDIRTFTRPPHLSHNIEKISSLEMSD